MPASLNHFAKLIPNVDLAENGYSLSVSSYVEANNSREAVDIAALNANIAGIVGRQQELRAQVDAIVRDLEDRS